MAAIRLTKDMREIIVKKLLEHRFAADEAALFAEVESFGRDVFAFIMGDAFGKLDAFPSGWFPTSDNILNVEIPNIRPCFTSRWDNDRACRAITFAKPGTTVWYWPVLVTASTPIPYRVSRTTPRVPRENPLWDRAEALNQMGQALLSERSEAGAKAHGLLTAHRTVQALNDAWPEVKPFVPEPVAAFLPPAIPCDILNSVFRLP